MQTKQMNKFRVVETRICPTCNNTFDAEKNLTYCPVDSSLLCPVNAGYTGQTVAGWNILDLIGEGSSGRVYKAQHGGTAAIAAIKFLKLNLQSDPSAVKRFQQEALAIKELNNASITALFDFGIMDDGTPYLIMEFVEGQTLQTILEQQGALSDDSIRTMFIQAAEAMDDAHSRGILHRDLKPGNIIVDSKKNVKILDFGLAKFCDTEIAASVTRTGLHLGTPAYMSPEQCTGGDLDNRSDIYSLGCVIYECLTGKQIFDTDKAVAFYHKHAFEDPIAPSKHFGKSSHVSTKSFKQLEELIMACLQKHPDDRVQSMGELADGLKGKQIRVRHKRQQMKLGSRRVTLAALIAGVLIGACFLLIQNNPPLQSSKPLAFTPPHAVTTSKTQRQFFAPRGLFLLINMEESAQTGFKDGSSIYRESDENNLREAMNSAAARECFTAWHDWYANIFAYLRANHGTAAPQNVRMKINVVVDRGGQVSANTEWSDPVSDAASQAFIDEFLASVQKLDGSALMRFPSSATDSVNFEIFLGPDSELKVEQGNQALR